MAEDIPVGARLGSERLYAVDDEHLAAPWSAGEEHPDIPERRDEPKPSHKPVKPPKPPHQAPQKRRVGSELKAWNWREFLSNVSEIAGIGAITAGSWQIAAWLGLVVLGLCLIILGVAIGVGPAPGRRKADRTP